MRQCRATHDGILSIKQSQPSTHLMILPPNTCDLLAVMIWTSDSLSCMHMMSAILSQPVSPSVPHLEMFLVSSEFPQHLNQLLLVSQPNRESTRLLTTFFLTASALLPFEPIAYKTWSLPALSGLFLSPQDGHLIINPFS